ncbi:MAG: response regulator [Limnospira sp.]
MITILIIEDEDSIRDSILDIFETEGFNAIGASNGSEGINLAQIYRPDLIVCDIMMPDMDGYGVLQRLQENPETTHIPFIFLTAKADRADQRLGMELGADDYLSKPCSAQELINAIQARLKKQQRHLADLDEERRQALQLKQRMLELQQQSHSHEELLNRLSEELRSPLSAINMAIAMLKSSLSNVETQNPEEFRARQQRYLKILQEECAREMAILNEVSSLKEVLKGSMPFN